MKSSDSPRVDVMVIAENSTGTGDLDIAAVITNTQARDRQRDRGSFEIELTDDLQSLDNAVKRALDRHRERIGKKRVLLGTVSIVAHASPGRMSIGKPPDDMLQPSKVEQLQALIGKGLQRLQLLGCDSGTVVDAVGRVHHGPVTMLAIAEFLKIPVLGMLTVLNAADFNEQGVRPKALADGNSWVLAPGMVRPANDKSKGERVGRALEPVASIVPLQIQDATIELRGEFGEIEVNTADLMSLYDLTTPFNGHGLLYAPWCRSEVMIAGEQTELQVLGAGEYLGLRRGPSRIVLQRTGTAQEIFDLIGCE